MKYQKLSLVIVIALASVLLFACDNPFWPEKTVKPEQEPEIPEVITDCGHNNYDEWLVTTHATCLTNGSRERDCIACGHKQIEVLTDANAHNWLQLSGTAATCTEEGEGGRECTLCSVDESGTLEIDPGNHNWGDFTQTTPPNCVDAGIKTRDCTRCSVRDDMETQVGEPKTSETGQHFFGNTTVTVPATCLKAGANGRKCGSCPFFTTNGGVVNALGHSSPTWIDNTATCTETGFETLKCNRSPCADPETRDTAALGHSHTAWSKNSTTTCLDEKRTCTRVLQTVACTYSEERTLAVTAHNWNGLWPRTGKLVKTCITKCKDNNDCTVTRTLDEEMVQIEAGIMPIDENEGRRNWGTNTITLSAFKMHKFQVTQDLYEAVMGNNPSHSSGQSAQQGERQEQRPVDRATWFDAVEFCIKLNQRENLNGYEMTNRVPTDAAQYPITSATVTWTDDQYFNGYRLPTEAEWEYACRAGTTTSYYSGNGQSQLVNYEWFNQNSNNRSHQVGLKLANPWGLFDMSANLREWCWDWFKEYPPLATSAQTNPKGPATGTNRTMRGEPWNTVLNGLMSHVRSGIRTPGDRDFNCGFRIVRNQPQQQ